MNIGKPKREFEVRPDEDPVPATLPMPEPATEPPVQEPVPVNRP
jgi:hypothetical protein